MSPLFLKQYRKKLRCGQCSVLNALPKKRGYTLCERHLQQIAEKWRCWSEQRRVDGLCCWCPRRSFRGWLRCRLHREINRLKCLAWNRANPEHSREEWKKRKQLRDAGFCPSCRDHRPLDGDYKRCAPCRKRRSAHC